MPEPPRIVTPRHIALADARPIPLPNGMVLYALPAGSEPVVRVSLVFAAGSVWQHAPFTASATANLLAEGSLKMTGQQIAEQLDYYGSWYETSIDRDTAYVSFAALSRFFPETMEVAARMLLTPTFPEREMKSYCARRRQRLEIERTRLDTQAREAFIQSLYGPEHPYGIVSPAADYDALTRHTVESFYRERYVAADAFAVCTGRVDDEAIRAIRRLAEALPAGRRRAPVPLPVPQSTRWRFVPHAGAVQSAIRTGWVLFPRTHPDFVGMQVVATVLGGYFSSRLMRNLREEHGYTYGAYASMVNLQRSGYMAVSTQVGAAATRDALRQIRREIERLRTRPVPRSELAMAKRMMTGEMMRILDGPFGMADATIENLLCNRTNEALTRTLEHIRRTTPEDVLRLSRTWLDPDAMVEVVAGDSAFVGDPSASGSGGE